MVGHHGIGQRIIHVRTPASTAVSTASLGVMWAHPTTIKTIAMASSFLIMGNDIPCRRNLAREKTI